MIYYDTEIRSFVHGKKRKLHHHVWPNYN